MTKKEIAAQNIGMTFDFIRHIIGNPGLLNGLPARADLDFVGAGFPSGSAKKPKSKFVARYKIRRVFEPVK